MPTMLRVVTAAHEETVQPERQFVVGRDRTADLVVKDSRVSRRHLVIEPAGAVWKVRDVSSNGTWLGGRRVREVAVLGETHLRLGTPTGPEVAVLPVPSGPATTTDGGADKHHSRMETLRRDSTAFLGGPRLPGPQAPERTAGAHERRRSHRLYRGTWSIGRSQDNDIVVEDLLASRRHAELLVGSGGVEIVDLGSANGTFVNGKRVTRSVVAQRDVIAVGHHLLQLSGDELVEYLDFGDVTFEAQGLSVFTSGVQILHDISFRLPGRALLAVIGPSGSGKSTLLNALTGFRPADEGTVGYAGRDMYGEYDELRRRIGHVPQDDLLHTTLTARKALGYGAELRFPPDTTAAERGARVDEVLDELGLSHRADVPIEKLSGGQRKRTSVALELLTRPTLLFLDEPTSGLDPGLDKNVMESLRGLADDGRTVVVVTHSVAHLDICDRVLVLAKGGYTAYFGPPRDALSFLGESRWSDVFEMLESAPGAELAARFRESRYYVPAAVIAPVRPKPEELLSTRQQSVPAQLLTLSRRQLSVIVSDRAYLALIVAFPFLLGVVPRLVGGNLEVLPSRPNERASILLTILVLCVAFMGTANSIREIVKERTIYMRERAIGLSRSAYLGSKVLVLTVITTLQCIVFTFIGAFGREPQNAVALGFPILEFAVALTMIAVSSAMIGLAVSSLVDDSDKTMPLLVLVIMVQLVLSGGIEPLRGKLIVEQLAVIAPARWGYAAIASVVDLNNVQKLGDPQFNPGSPVDPLWSHAASTYFLDIFAGAAVGVVAIVITYFLLRRIDPKVVNRKAPVRAS